MRMCPFKIAFSKIIFEEAELLVVHYHSKPKEFRFRWGTESEINFATTGAAKMGNTAHNVTCNLKL